MQTSQSTSQGAGDVAHLTEKMAESTVSTVQTFTSTGKNKPYVSTIF